MTREEKVLKAFWCILESTEGKIFVFERNSICVIQKGGLFLGAIEINIRGTEIVINKGFLGIGRKIDYKTQASIFVKVVNPKDGNRFNAFFTEEEDCQPIIDRIRELHNKDQESKKISKDGSLNSLLC